MAEPPGVENERGVRVLALCGESVLIKGIEASLKDRDGVEIALLDTLPPSAVQALNKHSPDIIIFDLTPDQLHCIFSYMRTHTDVVLIGLDIESDLALFLSGEWRMLPTLADLMQVVEERIHWIRRIQAKNSRQL